MSETKKPLGVIIGPTAVGKTDIAIAVAKRMGSAEIISADSIQVYSGMDIGSAKPNPAERQGIVHHMLDIAEPEYSDFSVAVFQSMATECIEDVLARSCFPIVCGGTGLYVNSLIFPLNFTETPSDEALRAELNAQEDAEPGSLHNMLLELDPKAAQRLHKNDRKRLVRAIEVIKLSGKSIDAIGGDFANEAGKAIPYAPIIYGLTMPREMLYKRIETRVDAMMQAGLLNEVKALAVNGCGRETPAMQGLGYKQLMAYIAEECTLEEAVALIKQETRRFAKRQLTWFRRDKRIIWLDVCEHTRAELIDTIYDGFCTLWRV